MKLKKFRGEFARAKKLSWLLIQLRRVMKSLYNDFPEKYDDVERIIQDVKEDRERKMGKKARMSKGNVDAGGETLPLRTQNEQPVQSEGALSDGGVHVKNEAPE